MGDVLITAPATEPVEVSELRAHLRDVADGDAVLTRLIKAAREYFEEETSLAMISQVRELTLDGWPLGTGGDGLGWWDGVQDGALMGTAPRTLELPRTPLIAIESITTYDSANAGIVWSAGDYYVDKGSRPGRLALNAGASWPMPTRPTAGIVIRYTAGHANAAAVPSVFGLAILQIAGHWYENRELVDYDGPSRVPLQAERIISKYRTSKL